MRFVPARLLGAPRPKPDELLSSYLLRVAQVHHLTPDALCALLWPDTTFWARDIDWDVPSALVPCLAKTLDLSETELQSLTLRGRMGLPARARPQGSYHRWVLPIGIYHRTRHAYGQMYCIECLSEQPVYLCAQWRLASAIVCPKHGRLLADACARCGAPFAAHRQSPPLSLVCHQCRQRLPEPRHIASLAPDTLGYLSRLTDALLGAARPVPGVDDVYACATVVARWHPELNHLRGPWLLWRVADRAQLWRCVRPLLDDWPRAFMDWCVDRRLPRCRITEVDRFQSIALQRVRDALAHRDTGRRRPRVCVNLPRQRGDIGQYRVTRAARLLSVALRPSTR